MSYGDDLPNLQNPPMTGISPTKLDIIIWRGCDFTAILPLQHQLEITVGQDFLFPNMTVNSNNITMYTPKNCVEMYASARMQIRKSWVRQGKTTTVPLIDLYSTELHYQFREPVPVETSGKFVVGFTDHIEIGALWIQIPHIITDEFNFCEGVYDLECIGKELDQNGKQVVDKLLYGNVLVLGELK